MLYLPSPLRPRGSGSFLRLLHRRQPWSSAPWTRTIRRTTSRVEANEIRDFPGSWPVVLWSRDLCSHAREFRLRARTSTRVHRADLGHVWVSRSGGQLVSFLPRVSSMRIATEVWKWGSNIWLITGRIWKRWVWCVTLWLRHVAACFVGDDDSWEETEENWNIRDIEISNIWWKKRVDGDSD